MATIVRGTIVEGAKSIATGVFLDFTDFLDGRGKGTKKHIRKNGNHREIPIASFKARFL